MIKYYFALFVLISLKAYSTEKIFVEKNLGTKLVSREVFHLEDRTGLLTFNQIVNSTAFKRNEEEVVDFGVSKSVFWLKFTVVNEGNHNVNDLIIEVVQPLLQVIDFYFPDNDNNYEVITGGQSYPFSRRKYKESANFIFDLDLHPGQEKTYYFKVRGNQQVLVPLRLTTKANLDLVLPTRSLWFGIYCGIILVMVLYNLFIFFSTRDKSYLYYVLHTFLVGLTQASLLGAAYKYLWPGSPWFGNYSIFLFTCLVSIVGVQFLIEFLHLKVNGRRIFYILKSFQGVYVFFIISSLAGFYSFTYYAILLTQSLIALFIISSVFYLYRKGFSEAKYYLIGWSSLMLGIIIYVSRDFGLLPYNNITAYALVIGSAAEITLLSFALADKINIYKLEKDKAKEKELFALLENERMVREQNLMLEKKVEERTHELHMANEDLNVVLQDLKDKESQLVESEKMAVLGQLTAGIAHEINNPINFVTSNVGPLKRDIEIMAEMLINIEEIGLSDSSVDVKQMQINKYKEDIEYDYLQTEIGHLIKGISEGANRTAEIVKGLRMSSRLDESDLRKADINDGLDTTMVLVNNLLGDKIRCVKDFGDLPLVECYPGKMNQVFLNIISNAIHAIAKKHQNDSTGVLNINTSLNEKSISIRIRDNGTGMDENTKKKIFEPFFTTKAVGEGTGLGMSIAYNIIKKHNGHILINSTVGQGTEFVIDIPIIHDIISN